MKRFTDIYKKRKIYSFCLLFAFTGAFICDFFCSHALDHDAQQHKSHFISSTNGMIAEGTHPHGQLHSIDLIHHHESNTDSCCEKQPDEIYEGLIKQETLRLDFHQVEMYFIELPAFIFSRFEARKVLPILNTSLSPPPGGRAVRILFQSFLC